MHLRAVTVQWLVAWTNENDCWDMSTRDVVTNVVLPMTASKGRCAVVMLPCVREKRVTGHVDVFMSHTWAGRCVQTPRCLLACQLMEHFNSVRAYVLCVIFWSVFRC